MSIVVYQVVKLKILFIVHLSRRGTSLTYAYIFGILALSNNYSCVSLALKNLEWVNNQNPVNNKYPIMLDGYTTYTGRSQPTSLGFSISVIIETLYHLYN